MGYDLHITRRKSWDASGNDITADEWLAYVRDSTDLELQSGSGAHFAVVSGCGPDGAAWLDWSDGQIYSKNPSPALIDRMVAIARHFGGTVQGDDGELYNGGSFPPRQPPTSLLTRVTSFLRRIVPSKGLDIDHSGFELRPGDDVTDIWGQHGVVVTVDPKAEHGGGIICVRYTDGREDQYLMIGHPFRKADPRTLGDRAGK